MSKSSKNYEWFKFFANNRPISKHHLNNLRKQFDEYGNITETSPIAVNKHGFIFDGQHRRILCEEFGYEVFYNEVDKKKELTPAMNTNNKPWDALNYVRFFADYKPEYEVLSRFITNNGIGYSIASAVLWPGKGRTWVSDRLVVGKLEVKDIIGEAQKRMDIISELGEIMGQPLTERYVRGILKCLYMDNFDINRFLTKAKKAVENKNSHLGDPRATTAYDVMKDIEGIYNFRTGSANTVLLFR